MTAPNLNNLIEIGVVIPPETTSVQEEIPISNEIEQGTELSEAELANIVQWV